MELTRQQKVFTFVGVLLGLLLGALDQTVVASAGSDMIDQLKIPPALYVWVAASYLLASTVLLPVWGRLSDLYGRRRVVLVGIVLFLGASALCGLSQTVEQLIAARALQGAGSASLFITAFAVVADMFSPAERGKYSGVFGAVFGLASLIGPPVGGFISSRFGWHWVFFVNVPVGALALFFIVTRMPPLERARAAGQRVDWVGAALLALAAGPSLLALTLSRPQYGEGGITPAALQPLAAAGLWALSLSCLALFARWEVRCQHPLIELSLFRGRVFAVGNAAVFVLGGAFMAPMLFLPLYLMRVQGLSQTAAGLAMVPMVLGVVVGNVASGQLSSRLGRYKALMLFGLVLLIGALGVMGFTLHEESTLAEVTWKMVLVGLGLGPSIPLYTVAIQNSTPPQHLGSATSLATFFRSMGSTVGVTVAGVFFAEAFLHAVAADPTRLEQVRARYAGARALAARALDGDPRSAALARQAPWVDGEAAALLSDTAGPRATVRKSLAGSPQLQHAEAAAVAQARAKLEEKLARAERRELERPGFTRGVRAVYQLAFALALLAAALTVLLPSVPLRKTLTSS